MKTYDNTLKYYELLMYKDDTFNCENIELPCGFHYEFYKEGDMSDWISIHIESGEFCGIDEGIEVFHNFFDSFINEFEKRCIFIVDNATHEKVGTGTISLLKNKEYGYDGAIDWIAIKRRYQGKKLSRALISKLIQTSNNLGHYKVILHTQTTTWLAAKLYLELGFNILNKDEKAGWNIMKTLTNHPKLDEYSIVDEDCLYDKRNIEIEQQLNTIFGRNTFNYSVWYKNGLHTVYVYCNNETFEYEYFEDNNSIRLEEIKNKKYKE